MVGSARHRRSPARSPARRSAAVLGLVLAIVAIAVAGTLFAVSERLGDDVVRVPDPFAALDPATRPAPTAAMTFLLVGTGIRVDHLAVIDFAGFRSVLDAIGGVDVGVAAPASSAGVAFQAGMNHLDGDAALVYVRQRHELAGGDLARAVLLTAPVRGAGSQGGQSVVLLDDARAAALWAALRGGTPAAYAQQHPDALLGPAPAGEEHP